MKYMGSKRRFAKDILSLILKYRLENQWYVEPFVGGANVIENVDKKRIGSDKHPYLIAFLKALSNDFIPPKFISEDEYTEIKNNKDKFPKELVGYVGFGLSYGGKWFGGYCRDSEKKRNYSLESYKNAMKQKLKIKDIRFVCCDYRNLDIPAKSIIYCDPPYQNTTKYKYEFISEDFWNWCREKQRNGNNVFISEYNAPGDFISIWNSKTTSSLTKNTGEKTAIENLFIHESFKFKKTGLLYL